MTVTEKDRDILARTLWGEARGESLAGQIAVAWTIRNRVKDGKDKSWWGEGYASVCQKPYQFSCWNRNDPNFAYLSGPKNCLLYTSPSPRDATLSRMPSSA